VKEIHMQELSHSLGDIPRRTARRYPDKVAIIDGDLTLTFAEFDELVDRAAAALRNNGFTAGDRIALLARNCWQYAVLAFRHRSSRGYLAGYKTPKQLYVFDAVPKNPSGKLLKRELRTRFGADQNVFH
jgi:acyl-CoA synthetase (AMP-forming)/AMP-acid ligase II